MQITVKTAAAQYTASRPASGYRKLFAHLTEQADIAVEVQRALLPSLGGNSSASFDEVIAHMARAKVRCLLQDMPACPCASLASQCITPLCNVAAHAASAGLWHLIAVRKGSILRYVEKSRGCSGRFGIQWKGLP